MIQNVADIFLMILNPLVFIVLFGWTIALYCFWKGEKFIGAAILFVWLALFMRANILYMLLRFLFGDNSLESSGILRQFLVSSGDVIISSMVLFVPILIVYIPYAFWKKQFVYVAVALLLVFPAYVSHIESYFIFSPLIDTTKSSRFTLDRFDMIRPGMTRDEVRGLIGDPVEGAGQYNAPCEGQTGDNAAGPYYDFAWLNSSVCYDETDRVVETKKLWVPD